MAKTAGTNSTKRLRRDTAAPNDLVSNMQMPDIRELFARLHFNPAEGRIWLEDSRMLLIHAEAFGAIRQELIDSVGVETARGLFTRMGYVAGSRDATLALKARGKSSQLDILATGAQFHSLEGIVRVVPVKIEMDSTRGYCYGEFLWENSFESELHVACCGIGSEPTCWMEIGYSSGFLSTLMGKRILVREVECQSMGHAICRAIAKPVEQWDDGEEDVKYLQPQSSSKSAHFKQDPKPAKSTKVLPDSEAAPASEEISKDRLLVGASAGFHSVMHKILRVAPTNATVLLLGESGVGKSAFAREVHINSRRSSEQFVQVNCAAIPEQLMESELFGVVRGAYSGANEHRPGRFEIANNGTLFLDEIATLSPTAQGKLLRVLQTGEMERLGSTTTIKVNVRVIAATNENLEKAVAEGRFRSDLYYRINVFPITIPSLRERKDDLPILLDLYLRKFSSLHCCTPSGITPRALEAILSHTWPGNIRELENVIERGVILGEEGEPLDIRHLFANNSANDVKRFPPPNPDSEGVISGTRLLDGFQDNELESPLSPGNLKTWATLAVQTGHANLAMVEEALVRAAIDSSGGNISKAATLLGVTRSQMDYKAKELAL